LEVGNKLKTFQENKSRKLYNLLPLTFNKTWVNLKLFIKIEILEINGQIMTLGMMKKTVAGSLYKILL